MNKNQQTGSALTRSGASTANTFKNPGKRFMTENGNMCVNFHNTCFIMDRLGNYVPWVLTLHHGKLMPIQEYLRLRGLQQRQSPEEPLTPFLNKKAAKIAAALKEDPMYKMTAEQRHIATINRENYLNAQKEGVTVEEYLRREAIRTERQAKKVLKIPEVKASSLPTKSGADGRTHYNFANVKGFEKLKQIFA